MIERNNKCPIIMDTTLRDGSYAINFSFTTHQTKILCRGLENVGIKYIEVGHGVGINASNEQNGIAIHSDKEYIENAKNSVKDAKIGVFCIPNIATLDSLRKAIDYGISFVRVGTNVDKIADSEKFIKLAKENNIEVFANYMKSYVLSPEDFAKNVKFSEECGADVVYIVDSAGGMMPGTIKSYYDAIRSVSNIKIGFHGHDNLGLAIANNIYSADLGIDYIDSSLQGLGRSAGNASTEILVAALEKIGYSTEIDLLKLIELGHKYILPLISAYGKEPLDIISGYAEFHSSYMSYIKKYSNKYNINPLMLIIENCKIDKTGINEELLDNLAKKIKENNIDIEDNYNFNRYFGHEQN